MTETATADAADTTEAATAALPVSPDVIVTRVEPTLVEIVMPLDDKELEAAQERAFRELAKNVRIPGFRPGKVPRRIFEAQYGQQAIAERAFERVVPNVYAKALRENDLQPVDEPKMEMLDQAEGDPVRIKATVQVRPVIELGTYDGVAVDAAPVAVTDADVQTALEGVARDAADLVPVERPVQLGDTATIDYAGKIDGVAFDGGTAEGQPTAITLGGFIPGFVEGIVGMSAGETKDVEAVFPEPYGNADLAGKTAVFTVTVHDVKEPQVPALDDDLAKRYKPDATLDELRTELRTRLEQQAQQQRAREISGKAMDLIVAAHDVPLPAVMIEREQQSLVDEAKGYVGRAGVDWDQYLADQSKTEADIAADYREEAERRVKATLILEAIAKREHIAAAPEDIEAEIQGLMQQYRQPREQILKLLQPNFNALLDGIVRTKTIDWIVNHAAVTDVLPAPPSESTSTTSEATDTVDEAPESA